MDTESRWRLPKIEPAEDNPAKETTMGDGDQSDVAQLMRKMAESSAAALTMMTNTAAQATQRADAADANLKAMQSQVNVLLKRMDTDQ